MTVHGNNVGGPFKKSCYQGGSSTLGAARYLSIAANPASRRPSPRIDGRFIFPGFLQC